MGKNKNFKKNNGVKHEEVKRNVTGAEDDLQSKISEVCQSSKISNASKLSNCQTCKELERKLTEAELLIEGMRESISYVVAEKDDLMKILQNVNNRLSLIKYYSRNNSNRTGNTSVTRPNQHSFFSKQYT